jgi:hypothetical protein
MKYSIILSSGLLGLFCNQTIISMEKQEVNLPAWLLKPGKSIDAIISDREQAVVGWKETLSLLEKQGLTRGTPEYDLIEKIINRNQARIDLLKTMKKDGKALPEPTKETITQWLKRRGISIEDASAQQKNRVAIFENIKKALDKAGIQTNSQQYQRVVRSIDRTQRKLEEIKKLS